MIHKSNEKVKGLKAGQVRLEDAVAPYHIFQKKELVALAQLPG